MIEVKKRTGPTEALPTGARLLERVARPLTGFEVKAGLKGHILELLERFTLSTELRDRFVALLDRRLDGQSEINKNNVVYPGVGWHVSIHREELGGDTVNVWASVELDLERDKRRSWSVGTQGVGTVAESIDDEQVQSRVPDAVREKRGLPVEADWVMPSTGQRGKVRMARSVDVGGAAKAQPVVARDETGLTSPEHQKEATEASRVPTDMSIEDIVGQPPQLLKELEKSEPKPPKPPGPGRKISYTTLKAREDAKKV